MACRADQSQTPRLELGPQRHRLAFISRCNIDGWWFHHQARPRRAVTAEAAEVAVECQAINFSVIGLIKPGYLPILLKQEIWIR